MKITPLQRSGSSRNRAFTLTEMMVTVSILMISLAGILVTHLFGSRLFEITKAKLGANEEARRAISLLIEEIRTAKIVRVGEGGLTNFTEAAVGTPQTGSALQIHATTNTSLFIRYFWDTEDQQLKRTTNGANAASIVASSITNNTVFTAENFSGTVLTNRDNNRVIGLTLQFYQIAYPIVTIGDGHYYDFYQLRTKITRRALE